MDLETITVLLRKTRKEGNAGESFVEIENIITKYLLGMRNEKPAELMLVFQQLIQVFKHLGIDYNFYFTNLVKKLNFDLKNSEHHKEEMIKYYSARKPTSAVEKLVKAIDTHIEGGALDNGVLPALIKALEIVC